MCAAITVAMDHTADIVGTDGALTRASTAAATGLIAMETIIARIGQGLLIQAMSLCICCTTITLIPFREEQ